MLKVALVTGAARRVGAEIATSLHAAGMNVIVHYNHSSSEAIELCKILNEKRNHSAFLLQAELSNIQEIQQLIKEALKVWGHLDVLINNASRFYKTPFGNITETAWNDLMNSNLKAPFFLCQAAREVLDRQSGCIINIVDIHGSKPMRDYSAYCISKAGLIMLTQALAQELGPRIRVNAIAPGIVDLPEGDNALSAEMQKKILNRIALHRFGTPKDIAKAVLFLAQDADFMTGQVLTIDGGRTLSM